MVRASSDVLYLLSRAVVANTEPKQVYDGKALFLKEL
jgi:hypothetical protein